MQVSFEALYPNSSAPGDLTLEIYAENLGHYFGEMDRKLVGLKMKGRDNKKCTINDVVKNVHPGASVPQNRYNFIVRWIELSLLVDLTKDKSVAKISAKFHSFLESCQR